LSPWAIWGLIQPIDDELGAGGILGYLVTTVEQLLIAHLIRIIISKKPSLLGRILFLKDGPLAFFGQTANFHKPFRTLVSYLIKEHALNLVGLEKSGPFVDHAAENAERLKRGSALILDNDYISLKNIFKPTLEGMINTRSHILSQNSNNLIPRA